MTIEVFHGSYEQVKEIKIGGRFGGVFAGSEEQVAEAHGKFIHKITFDESEVMGDLFVDNAEAFEAALKITRGNENLAEVILSAECEVERSDDEDPEFWADKSWDAQKMRGQLAAKLGFKAAKMFDEHGTTYLCLPGCSIELV